MTRHSVTREIPCPFGFDDPAKHAHRLIDIAIDDKVIILDSLARFHLWALASRRSNDLGGHRCRAGTGGALIRPWTGAKRNIATAAGISSFDFARALDIDIEQNVAARLDRAIDGLSRRAIAIVVHLSPFGEFTARFSKPRIAPRSENDSLAPAPRRAAARAWCRKPKVEYPDNFSAAVIKGRLAGSRRRRKNKNDSLRLAS